MTSGGHVEQEPFVPRKSTLGKLVRRVQRFIWGVTHPSCLPILLYLYAGKVPGEPSNGDAGTAGRVLDPAIPSKVFQTWKSTTDIPGNYAVWRESFFDLNPDFEVILWDDADNRAFIEANFAWFLPIYDAYPKEIFRADAVRPFYLFLNGGFYADMDAECLRPLSSLETSGDVVLARMGADLGFEHSVPNAIMASKPFQLFWLLFIALLVERSETPRETMVAQGPETYTGPIALKRAVDIYQSQSADDVFARCRFVIARLSEDVRSRIDAGRLQVLGQDVWYSIDWTNPIHRLLRDRIIRTGTLVSRTDAHRLFPKAVLTTYWCHSWEVKSPGGR